MILLYDEEVVGSEPSKRIFMDPLCERARREVLFSILDDMNDDDRRILFSEHLPDSDPVALASDFIVMLRYLNARGQNSIPNEDDSEPVQVLVGRSLVDSTIGMPKPDNAIHTRMILHAISFVDKESATELFNSMLEDDGAVEEFIKNAFGDELITSINELMYYYPRERIHILQKFIDGPFREIILRPVDPGYGPPL